MRLDKGWNILECLVIIILFDLSKDIECQIHRGYTLQVTRRVTVQEHCCVTIPCAFSASYNNVFTNSKGYWININTNDIVAATNTSIDKGTKSNFNITGDTDKGDCSLTITDVKKQDSGTYFFRFEGSVNYNYKIKNITVNVTDPPEKPEVVITSDDGGLVYTNSTVFVKEGQPLTLNCSAIGNKIAKVTWIKGNTQSLVWSTITITQSEADTYRCLAWDKHGFIEKHLQILPQDNKTEDKALLSDKENKVRRLYFLIGIVCGIAIVIFTILASKLIARKYFKMNICLCVPMEYERTEEPPEEDKVEKHLDKVYMNVDNLKPITKTSDDAKEQEDSNNNPNDQEEILYSNIVFSNQPTRTLPIQLETEYAEIVK
ncbi:uncharacterized protein LOC143933638 [Lithobates pipiens]